MTALISRRMAFAGLSASLLAGPRLARGAGYRSPITANVIANGSAAAAPTIFYASQAGQPTFDEGDAGGNPFASALIELLSRRHLGLRALPTALTMLTITKSQGLQIPDVPARARLPEWTIEPQRRGDARLALVLVFSDYRGSDGAASLPGARHDAKRVSAAFEKAGFDTILSLDPSRTQIDPVLRQFETRSTRSDNAVIYATGHGVEVDGVGYLLPGDYPVPRGADALRDRGIDVSRIARAARARRTNVLFYGACRDNPFAA